MEVCLGLREGMEARENCGAGEELEAVTALHALSPDEHDGEAVCGDSQLEFAVVEAEVFRGGHGTLGSQLFDLGGHEISGRAAHRVEGFDHVSMVVIDAENFNRCI